MNEKDIIEFYRNQVENGNETPPETCWEEIITKLDLDDTWDSISLELNRVLPVNNDIQRVFSGKNQATFTRLISIALPIVLFLLLILSDNRKVNPVSPEISAIGIPIVSVDQSTALQSREETAMISGQKDGETKDFSKAESVQQPGKMEIKIFLAEPVHVIPVTIPPAQSTLDPVVFMPSLSTSFVSVQGLAAVNESLPKGQFLSGPKLSISKFSVGISLTEKNTWMINQETIEGLDKQKLNTTKAKFLNDAGIILRYNQSERWSFEGSFFLLSKTGQSYRQYLNGIYNSKSYELRYFSIELSARHTFHKSLNINNVKFYYVAGAYISHLNTAYKRIDHSLYDVSTDYDPTDYGIIIGCEPEITLFDRFTVAPGLRIKYGIPNIFADQPGLPDELHSTRNASVEFRLNIILPFSNY
jgi:hypothetical protein